MPIPELTDDGLLPPGIHECTIGEVREHFAKFPGHSTQRRRLCEKLEEYLAAARSTEMIAWVAIDGSFTTSKPDPNDIDLVVVLRADHDFSVKPRPFEYNLVAPRRVGKTYGFDILVGAENTDAVSRYLGFFQKTRDDRVKGILKVVP